MQKEITEEVLDKGFITLVCYPQNGDLIAVNTARVSFGNKKDVMTKGDEKLLEYLIRNKHDSPFRHPQFTFRIKAPEFVMRQWYKHVVGIAYTPQREPDHAWNEISGRYVEYEPDFYFPKKFRKQSKDNKQASTDETIEENEEALELYNKSIEESYETYKKLIEKGTAKEMARCVLPLSFYTEVIWTASLQAVLNFISLRNHEGSQGEIREYALALKKLLTGIVPVTMECWEKYRS